MPLTRSAILAVVLTSVSVVLTAQSPQAPASPLGRWRAEFTGPIGPRPKMVSAVEFTIEPTPNGLAGGARTVPEWPGDLDVTEIKIEGDRLSFTGTGRRGWSTGTAGEGMVYHCCPKLIFDGSTKGDEMTLTLTWTSTEAAASARELPMKAVRLR